MFNQYLLKTLTTTETELNNWPELVALLHVEGSCIRKTLFLLFVLFLTFSYFFAKKEKKKSLLLLKLLAKVTNKVDGVIKVDHLKKHKKVDPKPEK